MKNKNRAVLFMLLLFLLTLSSFTLAKYMISDKSYVTSVSVSLGGNREFNIIKGEKVPAVNKDQVMKVNETFWLGPYTTAQGNDSVFFWNPSVMPKKMKKGLYAFQVWGAQGGYRANAGRATNESIPSKPGARGYVMGYINYDPDVDTLVFKVGRQRAENRKAGEPDGGEAGLLAGTAKDPPIALDPKEFPGYSGGGSSSVECNGVMILQAGGGGGAGANRKEAKFHGGNGGTMYGMSYGAITSGANDGSGYIFSGGNGTGGASSTAGKGGGPGTNYTPHAAGDYGAGGGGGYKKGAAGEQVSIIVNSKSYLAGSAGGGGASYIRSDNPSKYGVITTNSVLFQNKLKANYDSPLIGLQGGASHPAHYGTMAITYLGASSIEITEALSQTHE